MKRIVFYTNSGAELPPQELREKIAAYVGSTGVVYPSPIKPLRFESGLDLNKLKREGVVAVIVHDANEACAFGIAVEASYANIDAYEILGEGFYKLSSAQRVQRELLELGVPTHP